MIDMLHTKINGGAVVIIGDLHYSDKYKGSHIDYLRNCYRVMEQVELNIERIKGNYGKVSVIFLGDLFGVNEKIFTTNSFMLRVYDHFTRLKALTDGHVYSVRGNHDIGHNDTTSFETLAHLGSYLVPASHVDYFISDDDGIRFHFLHYGEETRELNKLDGFADVVLAHNDFGLPGLPDYGWFPSPKRLDLEGMSNLNGVSLVISGHIHQPSPEPAYVTLPSGNEATLFYPGCPTRVKVDENYDDCHMVVFYPQGTEVGYTHESFGLVPASELFLVKSEDDSKPEVDTLTQEQRESLTTIVGMLQTRPTVEKDLIELIQGRVDISPSIRNIATDLLTKELNKR